MVQSLYLDQNHPNISIDIKLHILKEVENKRDYHISRLLEEINSDQKNNIQKEYKKLSTIVHPAHTYIINAILDITTGQGLPVTIDKNAVTDIYESIKTIVDIQFILFLTYFPEGKELLKHNKNFMDEIKVKNMQLTQKMLK